MFKRPANSKKLARLKFKVSKEEWKKKYTHCAMGLRLDQDIDFDIDNDLTKRFIDKYVKVKGAIYGRPTNPISHYWWRGQLPKKKQFCSFKRNLKKYYEKISTRSNTL